MKHMSKVLLVGLFFLLLFGISGAAYGMSNDALVSTCVDPVRAMVAAGLIFILGVAIYVKRQLAQNN